MGVFSRRRAKAQAEAAHAAADQLARLEAAERLLAAVQPIGDLDATDSWLVLRLATATVWPHARAVEVALAHLLVRTPADVRARLERLEAAGWVCGHRIGDYDDGRSWAITAQALVAIEHPLP